MHHSNRIAVAPSCEASCLLGLAFLRLFRVYPQYRLLLHLAFDNRLPNEGFFSERLAYSMGIGKADQDELKCSGGRHIYCLGKGHIRLGTNTSVLARKSATAGWWQL